MAIIVQKYGGTSVADTTKIRMVAEKVVAAKRRGFDVVVVVSAMGHTTDELLKMAKEVQPSPDRRELDMLLSVGERISVALMAMSIQGLGCDSVSLTGSQCGIITNDSHINAKIIEIRPHRILDELELGRIVVVAGFQGISYKKEITTLGRGGSDTTAVALAAALGAEYCEIFSDVDGVFSTDPNIVPEAKKIDSISYQEMQEMAEAGAKVLNAQAVEFAKNKGITVYSRSTFSRNPGTLISRTAAEKTGRVAGVAYEDNLVLLVAEGMTSPQMSSLLDYLDVSRITGKQLRMENSGTDAQNQSGLGMSLVISLENMHDFSSSKAEISRRFGRNVTMMEDIGALSLIGNGINADNSNLRRFIDLIHDARVPLINLSTSSFRVTALVPAKSLRQLVALCHKAFIEDGKHKQA